MAFIVSLVRTKATETRSASSSRAASRGKTKVENEAIKEVKAEEEQSKGFAFCFKNPVAKSFHYGFILFELMIVACSV